MKKRKNILKEAGVLLIAVVMFLSTITVTADTNENAKPVIESPISPNVNKQVNLQTLGGTVVWDNGMNYDNAAAAQWDPNVPFDAFPADDFHFEVDTEVCDVHWIALYGEPDVWDWCIAFYFDDGTGTQPGTLWQELCFDDAQIQKEDLGDGYWRLSVDLPYNKIFEGCQKYWISIYTIHTLPPQSFWGMHRSPILLHQAVFMSQYFGFPHWTDSEVVFGNPYDMCFQLTRKCEPSVDVEKYVWDPDNAEWVDADTESEALDLKICTDARFKIVIHNNGECCDLYNIIVNDKMHDSLKFLSADPEPDEYGYNPPYHYMIWHFPGPLSPCETIEIYITAHVEGPACTTDYNYVKVTANCDCPPYTVTDDDYAYVHAGKKSRSVDTPFLNFLENYLRMFPILQLLLQRLGL